VACTRRLTSPDIKTVCACVFRPVKSKMRTLFKQNSPKLMVKFIQFALMKENVQRGAHALAALALFPR